MDTETVLTIVLFIWTIVSCFSRYAAYGWIAIVTIITLAGIVELIKVAHDFGKSCDDAVRKAEEDLASGELVITPENHHSVLAAYTSSGREHPPDDYPYFLGG